MNSEEVDRSIKAIFDQQMQNTINISRLDSSISELKESVSELTVTVSIIGNSVTVLTDDVNVLAATVTTMAIQAEADRQIINNRMNQFERQAEIDRQDMRNNITEMRNAMIGLANIAGSTIRRVNNLESRVDNLESPSEKP